MVEGPNFKQGDFPNHGAVLSTITVTCNDVTASCIIVLVTVHSAIVLSSDNYSKVSTLMDDKNGLLASMEDRHQLCL